MLQLPNGCRCSEPSVFPKEWKTSASSITKRWRIQYYFYDPEHGPKGMLQVVKSGINNYKDYKTRKHLTISYIAELKQMLLEGLNPIKGTLTVPEDNEQEISQYTPLINALEYAFTQLECTAATKQDIRSVLKYFSLAAYKSGYSLLPVGNVKKRHIKIMLNNCCKVKEVWNANQYNHYRKYLSILFKELDELDAIEYNPAKALATKIKTQKIRLTLSVKERKQVSQILQQSHYNFWLFTQIFFHSGARKTELLSLKGKHVDIANQRYMVTIKKGKVRMEVWKTIKNVALPFWQQVTQHMEDEKYIFGCGLQFNQARPTTPKYISKLWQKYVKMPLDVKADFYSLKHSNTTEVTDALNEADAAALNSHTSTAMVVNIYDTRQAQRQHERLKKVNNEF